MPGRVASAACLEQEPCTPLGLVNPNFDEAGSRNVVVFFADAVGLAEARGECLALLAQLGEHVLRLDVQCIIVRYALQAGDVADGPERGLP
jgi:hypothetical protein